MPKSIKSAAASKAPTFNIKPLVAACDATEKVWAKTADTRNQALDKLADKFRSLGVTVEMLKGNAKTSAPRGVIKTFFDHLAEKGLLTKASAASYQTCFWIAFEKSVPFSPSLANQATKAKAKENVGTGKKADDSKKVKGSIVVKASRDNLQSLLLQTIKMARDLGLKDFALELAESGREIDLLPKDFK